MARRFDRAACGFSSDDFDTFSLVARAVAFELGRGRFHLGILKGETWRTSRLQQSTQT